MTDALASVDQAPAYVDFYGVKFPTWIVEQSGLSAERLYQAVNIVWQRSGRGNFYELAAWAISYTGDLGDLCDRIDELARQYDNSIMGICLTLTVYGLPYGPIDPYNDTQLDRIFYPPVADLATRAE